MPPVSASLLFTWSVESVLLGLIGLALFGSTWSILSQLILASVTAAAQLALSATQYDAHHEVAVAYLCVVTGLTTVHALRPLSSLGEIMGMCFFAVTELAALGMTFASCEGGTPLFLHPRGLGVALVAVFLDSACWDKWMGLVAGLALSLLLAVPWKLTALIVTTMAALALLLYESIVGDWARFAVAAFIMIVAVIWGLMTIEEGKKQTPSHEIPVLAPAAQRGLITWPRVVRPTFKDL